MSTLPRRAYGFAATLALVALGAAVAAVILVSSGGASDVDLTSANLVPEDSGLYFALNTDLSSSQWVAAFKLAERLGEPDAENQLKDSVTGEGIDWEDEVAPFLGGNAAVFVRNIDIAGRSAQGGAIIKTKDAKKALKVFKEQSGGEFEGATRDGVDYESAADMGMYVAIIDGHLVITTDEESLFAVIAVNNGKAKALSTVPDFQRLRDGLTKNFLGFLYVSTEKLAGDYFLNDPVFKRALQDSGTGDLVFKPMAMVWGARSEGFEFDAASVSDGGKASPLMAPHTSRFASLVPGETAIFVSATNVAQTWRDAVDGARAQIDAAIKEEGTYRSLDEAMKAAGAEAGLTSVEELIDLLQGETAIAAWFPDGTQESAEGLILFDVKDAAQARTVIDKVFKASAKGALRTETVGTVEVTVAKTAEGDEVAYAITDGYAAVGSLAGVKGVLARKDAPLSDLTLYKDAVGDSQLGAFAFFNLQKLLALTEGGVPPELDQATRALDALIINAVKDDKGLARISGVVTVAK
ncbi:MAG: DUF3352 domain-containing protein [Chloroflexi bacterium]|nr:DUF3352 domain-containing protein [Chloroflexota bacterium]